MKKTMKRLSALLIGMMIALSSAMAVYADEGYTYNYDYWGDIQYSPDAYEVSGVYSAVDFGLETGLKTPSGLFVYEDMIYICDTGNNRILEIQRTGSQTLELIRVIDSFKGGEGPETFSSPQDVAVTDDGYIFIADTNNMSFLLLIGYVMLTRLDFDLAKKQFAFATITLVITAFIPLVIMKCKNLKN